MRLRRLAVLGILLVLALAAWWVWLPGLGDPDPKTDPPADRAGVPRAESALADAAPSAAAPTTAPHLSGVAAAPEDAGPTRPPRALRGRVRTATFDPVAGATVWVARIRSGVAGLPVSLLVTTRATMEDALRIARTDETGRFEIPDLPGGRLVVAALADGYGLAETYLVEDSATDALDLLLGPEEVLEGDVVDEEGRGIPGARVLAAPRSIHPGENLFSVTALATHTDLEGRFVLRGHPQGFGAGLFVSAAGFVSRSVPWEAAQEAEERRPIRLRTARELTVRVVELETGRPVVGAVVVVEGWGADGWKDAWVGRGLTGADGVARVPASLARRTSLRALHPDYAPYGRSLGHEPLEEPWHAEVWLARPAALFGRVVDGAGRPVEGAWVMYPLAEERIVATGRDGNWRFENLPPAAALSLAVRHPDYLPGSTPPLAFGEGEAREVPDVVLRRGVRLVVDVMGADGGLKKDALVSVADIVQGPAARLTDARGRADLGLLSPGYVVVSVSLEGHRSEAHRVLLKGEGSTHVEPFRLAAGTDGD